ncbi:succinylglutamate desuccinylase/aspartoacylase family protein [Reinekea sp.]|uniref:succinylglutamate desuccinylase/aspartoacylase family protein n=1 Tax=Reinekea sp. TaxID=1970455 RepID=UPI0039896C9E
MAFELQPLATNTPGQQSNLAIHRFGPTSGQKVYIQAGLHADEHPGLLVAQHLIERLAQLEQADQLKAHFVIVPFANPIGLKQRIFGHVNGRCDLATGQNFNRGMSIERAQISDLTELAFTADLQSNDVLFRQWLLTQIEQRKPSFEIAALHQALLSHSIDAHYVLDLHCDDVALPHVFYGSHQHEDGQLLAHCMSANVALEEDVTGTVAFDGSHTQPWILMQALHSESLFKQPCFAATLELRGQADVSPVLADQDAEGILNFFLQKGLINNLEIDAMKEQPLKTIGVDQVKLVNATAPGIVTYNCDLGDFVKAGDVIAQIALLDQPTATKINIAAPCDGLVFSQTQHFYANPGQTIAMLATNERQQAAGTQLAF